MRAIAMMQAHSGPGYTALRFEDQRAELYACDRRGSELYRFSTLFFYEATISISTLFFYEAMRRFDVNKFKR